MELFRLFGSILIDDKEAIETLKEADKKGKETTDNMDNNFLKLADSVGKSMVVVGTAVAAAIGGTAIAAVKFGDDVQKAMNTLQTSTGASADELDQLQWSMTEVYKNGFGEDMDDIALAMAEVKKQTGLFDDELQWATESALLFRDTFGFEVEESVRASSIMMKEFGLSSDEAYELIAQGAQNGLNKNGDLMDILTEYPVHFEQMGFSAEEMMNMLLNGTESGAFSVDKLGDAMKEFGIRTKDESQASADAFEMLGLNADEMFANFAAGGDTSKQAFQTVNEALLAMDDPLAQNQAGVALYGTMWEDLGVDAVSALTNMNGEIGNTGELITLMDLNENKYNSFSELMQTVGRNLQTSVLLPISDKLMPILTDLANKFIEYMPQIESAVSAAVPVIETIINNLAAAIGWTIDNLNIIIPIVSGFAGALAALMIISTVKKLIDAWKASTIIQTIAQQGLNAVLSANPIGVVVTLIGLLIAAGVALYMNWDTVKTKATALWSSISSTFTRIKNSIVNAFETAKEKVSGVIDSIKGFFTGLKLKLPKIEMPKLPSFSISGGFSLKPLSVPKLSVNWNAAGGIFDEPTIFNTSKGLQGVGEAGPEAILPLNKETYGGMAEGIVEAISKMTGANVREEKRPIILQVDGKTFAEIIGDYTDNVDGSRIRTVARGLA